MCPLKVVTQLSPLSRVSVAQHVSWSCWRPVWERRCWVPSGLTQHQPMFVPCCFETKPKRLGRCKANSNAAPKLVWLEVSPACDAPNTGSLIVHVLTSCLGACRQHLQAEVTRLSCCPQLRPSPCRPRRVFETAPFPKSCNCHKDLYHKVGPDDP